MGCAMVVIGMLMPRFVLLVGWSNDQAYWQDLFGSTLWLGVGFLIFPWTTLIYGLVQTNGLSLLNIIFIVAAFLLDLSTYGIGVFAARKRRPTRTADPAARLGTAQPGGRRSGECRRTVDAAPRRAAAAHPPRGDRRAAGAAWRQQEKLPLTAVPSSRWPLNVPSERSLATSTISPACVEVGGGRRALPRDDGIAAGEGAAAAPRRASASGV